MSRRQREKRGEASTHHESLQKYYEEDKEGFCVKILPDKGRAVFSTRKFKNGEFLLFYKGELIDRAEGERRESEEETGYRYFFDYTTSDGKMKRMCVDATKEAPEKTQPTLGRLVNHGKGKMANCRMRVKIIAGAPTLCLFALKDIKPDTELLYDYDLPRGFQFPPPYYEDLIQELLLKQNQTEIEGASLQQTEITLDQDEATLQHRGPTLQEENGQQMEVTRQYEEASLQQAEAMMQEKAGEQTQTEIEGASLQQTEITLDQDEATLQHEGPTLQEENGQQMEVTRQYGEASLQQAEAMMQEKAGEQNQTEIEGASLQQTEITLDQDEATLQHEGPTLQEENGQQMEVTRQYEEASLQQAEAMMQEKAGEQTQTEIEGASLQQTEITLDQDEATLQHEGPTLQEENGQQMKVTRQYEEASLQQAEAMMQEKAGEQTQTEIEGASLQQTEITLDQDEATLQHEGPTLQEENGQQMEVTRQYEEASLQQAEAMMQEKAGEQNQTEIEGASLQQTEITLDQDEATLQHEGPTLQEENGQQMEVTRQYEEASLQQAEDMMQENAGALQKVEETLQKEKAAVQQANTSLQQENILQQDQEEPDQHTIDSDSDSEYVPDSYSEPESGTSSIFEYSGVCIKRKAQPQASQDAIQEKFGAFQKVEKTLQKEKARKSPQQENILQQDQEEPELHTIDSDSGSEYVPDSYSETESDTSSIYEYRGVCKRKPQPQASQDAMPLPQNKRVKKEGFAMTPSSEMMPPQSAHNENGSAMETLGTEMTDDDTEDSKDKNTYKKPYRFCIFCKRMMSKLRGHIEKMHKDEERVRQALKLEKRERDQHFDAFKKEGILEVNKQRVRKDPDNPKLERERRKEGANGASGLVMCELCKAFIERRYIARHEKKHAETSDAACIATPLPASMLSMTCEDLGKDFAKEIVSKFREGPNKDVYRICTTDRVLLQIGKKWWNKLKRKTDKKTEVRRTVMADMRRLASLYSEMKCAEKTLGREMPEKEGNVSDMFKRANFRHLEEAIDRCTTKDSSDGTSTVKAGLKLALYYLLKGASKVMRGMYLIDDQDTQANDVANWVVILDINKDLVFGDASYKLNQTREEKLRRPEQHPEDDDIKKIRQSTMNTISEHGNASEEEFTAHTFVALRDALVCRLTLFNARRGGEPSRLRLKTWHEANSGTWLDQRHLSKMDPIDKALASTLKVGYQTGKGNHHLVPVLFPQDCVVGLRKLADKGIRKACGIAEENDYLFPTVRGGTTAHVSGWHAVKSVCDKLVLMDPEKVTATQNRHRVSTEFALMDLPMSDRAYIYKHLGHSEQVNQNVYQAPLALQEIMVVGRRLQTIDMGDAEEGQNAAFGAEDEDTASEFPTQIDAPSSTEQVDSSTEFPPHIDKPPSTEQVESSTEFQPHIDTPSSTEQVDSSTGRAYTHWDAASKKLVVKYFEKYLTGETTKKLPGKNEVQKFLQEYPTFKIRNFITIRSKVMNEKCKRERLVKKLGKQ